ncbi:M56 family metallopeptidase [Solirubrobacter ginsenosidimutans]|uniref:M56 family metallopeptidase n=1 Tax=Solirubrobacter ginsenosidimutans TaxID=490573 RepID=A0A9X3MVD9_9ACTN|nr:M56 family metallopeptidase [Solirubrobacter ginsenosidimutans]MDA0163255.1 M56 family metallopeptidase [Solirubrobacter ginsenosidimutans]
MIGVAAGVVVLAAIGLPHLLRLERTPAGFAAAIWLSVLLLRAMACLAAAVAAELYLPVTGLVTPLESWCVAGSTALSGHDAADFVLALPALTLAASLCGVMAGLWRASRRVQTLLRTSVVGPGPDGSLVVADGAMLVAVAGLRRPKVVISAGALVELDDDELLASLAHEQGHIALRHRYLLVAGELARAVARFLPGTRAAARELLFSLERDADRYALERSHDPAVLASAIFKAARGSTAPAMLALGGGVVVRRARLLLEAGAQPAHLGLIALAPVMAALVAASAIALPFVAHAGYHRSHEHGHACSTSHSV